MWSEITGITSNVTNKGYILDMYIIILYVHVLCRYGDYNYRLGLRLVQLLC